MYDFIGDVHGQSERLEALLVLMGYSKHSGVYSHPQRKAFFIGDLIDRGPQQVQTLEIVRLMVEGGHAEVVLGNHEYNGCAWATPDPESPGEYLRPHTEKNRHQHRAFLDQVGEGSALHRETVSWFKTLPVFVETPEFRAIHACWHGPFIEQSRQYLDANNVILPQSWVPMSRKDTEPYFIIENLLKGTEIELPAGLTYFDPDGNERNRTRTRWWDETATTYRSAGMLKSSLLHQLPEASIPAKNLLTYDQAKPLFIGHYWMTGRPSLLTPTVACLDYSIGKGTRGTKLCAYRWNGEQLLNSDAFVWVDALESHLAYTPSVAP
ncbi:metallophosphoesterase [Pseudomonas fluorescens]|uniref:metallophosphoesterase n=1 Tax=Pseudomonas TaxID=286 RepID=UPI000F031BD2|nr:MULTISPECIES: metallophosphoesterase [Pseudomonas]MBD8088498.1 metallophosphoesterase [Pseudomonas fluorescens]MBD8615055.1 metallophosphoesterase [Pseudomonas putida]MBD8681270.1 metallophosphoesterase [Pseudomonas sp. CFBP 13719]